MTMIKNLLFISLFFLAGCSIAHAATSHIVIDAESGEVISSSGADIKKYPASLTKMMTLYLLFEAIEDGKVSMDDTFKVSRVAAGRSPSKLGAPVGAKIKVRTLVDALIVKSANDCATVVAEGLAGTEAEFAKKMTAKAKLLGMKNTTFKNASGLPNRAQISTARDMAKLGAAMYKNFPQHYHLFAKKSFTYNGQTIKTHNHLLKTYNGADGMKTGYIAASGYNIITSAKKDSTRVIAVALGHKSVKERDTKVASLMTKGLNKLALNNQSTQKVYAKLENISIQKLEKKSNDVIVKTASNEQQNIAKWAIQVGAFSNYAKARNYALGLKKSSSNLKGKKVNIEPVESSSAIVYRSQLIGFNKISADNACKSLKKSNKSCIVISTNINEELVMANR